MSEETELRTLQASDTNDFVVGTVEAMHQVMWARMETINPNQRFLMMGRAALLLFNLHFNMIAHKATETLKKQEQQAGL